ncbi:MAG: hypothetical protein QNJ60_21215 [Xenococcaceae cyanobacterium MO_188.B19]|nr:hypothetical protein [Xenococcaceae cyanobacterium MO_188.B19]
MVSRFVNQVTLPIPSITYEDEGSMGYVVSERCYLLLYLQHN